MKIIIPKPSPQIAASAGGVGVDHLEDGAARRAVRLPVERRGHDVGEAAQRVEVVLLVVIERRLVPQPAPDLVGRGVDGGVVRVVDQIERAGATRRVFPVARAPFKYPSKTASEARPAIRSDSFGKSGTAPDEPPRRNA